MMPPMRDFWVADLRANGELHSHAAYSYALLEQIPGVAEIIGTLSSHLYRQPDTFETPLPGGSGSLIFRWRASASSGTAGIATVRSGVALASISLLASGLEPQADVITLDAFQAHLVRQLHDSGFEPAFGLLRLRHRPLVATVTLTAPTDTRDSPVIALADRCFAAALFRYLHLV